MSSGWGAPMVGYVFLAAARGDISNAALLKVLDFDRWGKWEVEQASHQYDGAESASPAILLIGRVAKSVL